MAILFIVMAFLAGCNKVSRTPDDTLVVALGAAPVTLDPRLATDANGARISGLMFNSLVRAGNDFRPHADASERWELKDRTYTFYLRRDLRFHNGRELTPEDVLFSFGEFRAKKSPFASSLANIKSVSARREPGGGIAVAVELFALSEKFLIADLPSVKLLPAPEARDPEFPRRLIGTGPFKYKGRDLNQIFLDGVNAKVAHLTFKIIRDDYTRYLKLRKREVDIAQNEIPLEKIREFAADSKRFQVFRYPGLSMTYVLVNFKDPVLAKLEVRRALDAAIDRQTIIEHKLFGMAKPATSLLTPINPYYHAGLKGYSGPLAPPPEDEFELKTSNAPQAVASGVVIANQLRKAGFRVRQQSYEWSTFYADVRQGRFQLATMRWVGTVDPDLYRMAFHSREVPPGRNRGSYVNPELDRLLDRAPETREPKLRNQLMRQGQEK